MRLVWASVLADLDLFRAELSADFGTWSQLPDFDLLAMIPIWRQLGSRADRVYAADRYELYKRFGIEMEEWVERCGRCDFDALLQYRSQRTLARSILPRSIVIDRRFTRENAQMAERIRRQIDEAGITSVSLSGAEVTDGVAFVVDSMAVHLRVILHPSGIRIHLVPEPRSDRQREWGPVVSHALAFIDTYAPPTELEIAALKKVVGDSTKRFHARLSECGKPTENQNRE